MLFLSIPALVFDTGLLTKFMDSSRLSEQRAPGISGRCLRNFGITEVLLCPAFMWVLNERPRRHIRLKVWSTFGETLWKGTGGVALLE